MTSSHDRTVTISGASGFVGLHLTRLLAKQGHQVSGLVRGTPPDGATNVIWHSTGDLSQRSLDADNIPRSEIFIHLAAPVRTSGAGSDEARAIAANVVDFIRAKGIPKLLVMSSIAARVAWDDPGQSRQYGRDKLGADQYFVSQLGDKCKLIILRPPAIYGPKMSNSLSILAGLVRRKLPIPLGSAIAARSYLSLSNLGSLVTGIVASDDSRWEQANGKIFEPSDGDPVSTRDVIRHMGKAMNVTPVLVPFPIGLLRLGAGLAGKSDMASGAIDPLEAKSQEELYRLFGWRPVESMPESFAFMASRA